MSAWWKALCSGWRQAYRSIKPRRPASKETLGPPFTSRRDRFKSRWLARAVWVQVPPSAPRFKAPALLAAVDSLGYPNRRLGWRGNGKALLLHQIHQELF